MKTEESTEINFDTSNQVYIRSFTLLELGFNLSRAKSSALPKYEIHYDILKHLQRPSKIHVFNIYNKF